MLIKCSACKFQRLLHILKFLYSLITGRKSLHDFIIISWMEKRARERFMSHFIIFSWRAPMLRVGVGYEHCTRKKNISKPKEQWTFSWREKKKAKKRNFHFNGFCRVYKHTLTSVTDSYRKNSVSCRFIVNFLKGLGRGKAKKLRRVHFPHCLPVIVREMREKGRKNRLNVKLFVPENLSPTPSHRWRTQGCH